MEKFKIIIREISEKVVEVEAETYKAAREQVEADYWKNPNEYVLEPVDTFIE